MTTEGPDSLPEIMHANRIYTLGSTVWGNGCTFGEYPVQVQKVQRQWVLANVRSAIHDQNESEGLGEGPERSSAAQEYLAGEFFRDVHNGFGR